LKHATEGLANQCRMYCERIAGMLGASEERQASFELLMMTLRDLDDPSKLQTHEKPLICWLAMAKGVEILEMIHGERNAVN
jgi:hypothetical protein